jgi:hypothetical protein
MTSSSAQDIQGCTDKRAHQPYTSTCTKLAQHRKPSQVSTLQQLTHAVGVKHHAALNLALSTQWSMDCEGSAVALWWAHHVTTISLQTQPHLNMQAVL